MPLRVCGVDDAGRGPVIGPLVIAGIRIEEEKLDLLKSLGVKDSKKLSPEVRTELATKIPKIVDEYHIVELEAAHLDLVVNRSPRFQRLNVLEARAMAEEIKKEYGDIGSGYATDPKTVRFLGEYYLANRDFPPIVRRSWKTLRNIVREISQSKLG